MDDASTPDFDASRVTWANVIGSTTSAVRVEMWDDTNPDAPHLYFVDGRQVTADEYAARPPLWSADTPVVDGSRYTRAEG